MASMTAQDDHWNEYESELAVLRTSIAEHTATRPAPQISSEQEDLSRHEDKALFLTSVNSAEDSADNIDGDDDGEAAFADPSSEDPEKIVQNIRDRVNALMSEDD